MGLLLRTHLSIALDSLHRNRARTFLSALGIAIGVAVVIYGVLVLALHCIRRSDLELLPKGDKLARLLHIS